MRPKLLLIGLTIKAFFRQLASTKERREMKDPQQTVGEMMNDRAVSLWHLPAAQKKTSCLYCFCKEMLRKVLVGGQNLAQG